MKYLNVFESEAESSGTGITANCADFVITAVNWGGKKGNVNYKIRHLKISILENNKYYTFNLQLKFHVPASFLLGRHIKIQMKNTKSDKFIDAIMWGTQNASSISPKIK